MDNYQINQCLISGNILPGVLPHIDNLEQLPFVFEQNFGLLRLPTEPGIILIRGPRQYGKSTWLEQQIEKTIREFGKGTALYLNGDEIKDHQELLTEIRTLLGLFAKSPIKRIFIDEITAIPNWEKAVKRIVDSGELKDILLITTGSKATDLRRGEERLPGRKGKLSRTKYIFTPISYRNFFDMCESTFQKDSVFAYILSGGSPIAINALAQHGRLPEYVIELINDWIFGEFAASGRSRAHLMAILETLFRMACTPIGQAKLARESGLANNTVAQGHIELLSDLMTVMPAFPYDPQKKITIFRKPCKYHFVNLLMAICWHPKKPRSIDEIKKLDKAELGSLLEWTVAQEIWRRQCIASPYGTPEFLNFWQSKEHEVDFVLPETNSYIEIKSGKTNPIEFSWFLKNFAKEHLLVINQNRFDTTRITGTTLADFMLSDSI